MTPQSVAEYAAATQRDSERGLFGIAWFAFLLGFAHEEVFEIIALCAGSNYCLELEDAGTLRRGTTGIRTHRPGPINVRSRRV